MKKNEKMIFAVKLSDIKFPMFYKESDFRVDKFQWGITLKDFNDYNLDMYQAFCSVANQYVLVELKEQGSPEVVEMYTGRVLNIMPEDTFASLESTMAIMERIKKHPLAVCRLYDVIDDEIMSNVISAKPADIKAYLDIAEKLARELYQEAVQILVEQDYEYAANENKVYEFKKIN